MHNQNLFSKELKALAQQRSPTLFELANCKSLDNGGIEDVNVKSAFTLIASYYIKLMDNGDIKFNCQEAQAQFMWWLQLTTDCALDGNLTAFIKDIE